MNAQLKSEAKIGWLGIIILVIVMAGMVISHYQNETMGIWLGVASIFSFVITQIVSVPLSERKKTRFEGGYLVTESYTKINPFAWQTIICGILVILSIVLGIGSVFAWLILL